MIVFYLRGKSIFHGQQYGRYEETGGYSGRQRNRTAVSVRVTLRSGETSATSPAIS